MKTRIMLAALFAVALSGCALAHLQAQPGMSLKDFGAALQKVTYDDAVNASSLAATASQADVLAPYRKECYDTLAAHLTPGQPQTLFVLPKLPGRDLSGFKDKGLAISAFEVAAEVAAAPPPVVPLSSQIGKVIAPDVLGKCAVLRTSADQIGLFIAEIGASGAAVVK